MVSEYLSRCLRKKLTIDALDGVLGFHLVLGEIFITLNFT